MKEQFKVKFNGKKRLMECRKGCGQFVVVGLQTVSVVCSACHIEDMYSFNAPSSFDDVDKEDEENLPLA